MINSTATELSIRKLIVSSKGKIVFDESFHDGVNIIRGENGSGKSIVADFLFFVLGGDLTKWKPEALRCDYVIAEVRINKAALTLRRQISESSRRPMEVFWGAYAEAQSAGPTAWEVYPFQRSDTKSSFSQILFKAMDFPEVRGNLDSNLTMHQILRMLYVDQLSNVQSLLRDEMFDSPLTRKTLGDLLLGVYDDTLYADELDLRQAQGAIETVKAQIASLKAVLGEQNQETDARVIEKQITENATQLEKVNKSVEKYFSQSESGQESIHQNIEDARQRFIAAQDNLNQHKDRILQLTVDVDDSVEFINELQRRIKALRDSDITRTSLNSLPITYCPVCLAPIDQSHLSDTCPLCKQNVGQGSTESRLKRLRQEIEFQIKESGSLLETKQKELERLRLESSSLENDLNLAQSTLNQQIRYVRTKRDKAQDDLLVLKGRLESESVFLQKQLKATVLLSQMRDRQASLGKKISELSQAIETKRQKQLGRAEEGYVTISEIAKTLLEKDIPTEEVFMNADKIAFDFEKNTFGVNDRNQFSASSIVYLKNSLHYSIFFASTKHSYFRYPRFMLCDNMEDKGMQEARSRNFQCLIVDLASRSSQPFQIIFTTSMIDPSLENSTYCVGRHYTLSKKSLEFNK